MITMITFESLPLGFSRGEYIFTESFLTRRKFGDAQIADCLDPRRHRGGNSGTRLSGCSTFR
jgi:hypothetical protein